MGNDAFATVTTATTGTTGTAGDYAAPTGRFCFLHSAIIVNVRAIIAAAMIFRTSANVAADDWHSWYEGCHVHSGIRLDRILI